LSKPVSCFYPRILTILAACAESAAKNHENHEQPFMDLALPRKPADDENARHPGAWLAG
jgi:hypothetical protein